MSVLRGGLSNGSSRRGQSTLMGMVLLIGMVAAGSLGIFLVAGEMLSSVEQDSETERVEQGFVQLSQEMATASSGGDVSRSMDVDVGDSGAVVMSETGSLRIQGGDVDKNITIGAIEYTGEDGTRIAYQAGGVFRETGNETQVVSAPPIQYDAASETLSFPIVKTRGESRLDSGNVRFSHYETDPLQNTSLVANDTVTIEITSEYYRGWEAYFDQQAGATTVQNVEVHDDDRGTVTAEFGFREVSDAFQNGAIYATEFETKGGSDVEDAIASKAAYPELDSEIEKYVNKTDPEDGEENVTDLGTVNSSESHGDGLYFADGIEGGHLDFDLSDGNATLVVDGDINADGDTITVSEYEPGNSLSVYLTGDYDARNGGNTCVTANGNDCEDDGDAKVIQMVASSESEFDFGSGGKARYEGVIYAGGSGTDWSKRSSCQKQICFHSNPSFYGSLVASSVKIQGGEGGLEFDFDESLQDADLSIYPDPDALPPQITYLNVAEHVVEIERN